MSSRVPFCMRTFRKRPFWGIVSAAACALALLGSPAWAQDAGEDIIFTLDRERYSFGRAVPLRYDFTCDNRGLAPTEIEDNGSGQLAFTIGFVNLLPTVGCVPVSDASWNLKDLFALTPGDYTLTVRQPGGDPGDQVFDFTIRDSVLESGPAQSGSWFDPAQSGQGLNLEFFNDGRAIAYWYAYDEDGDNLWLVGDGRYDGDEAVFDVFEAAGNGFPPNYDPVSHELDPWGEMTLTLDTCRSGTLSWTTSNEDFANGFMPLQRISPQNGEACFDDELQSDGWRTTNLLAEDPELGFELLNATLAGAGEGGDWTLAFEDLPEALGGGRGLTARATAGQQFARFYLGTRIRGGDRTEFEGSGLRPPYALIAELTVALPGAAGCDALNGLSVSLSLMDSLWDRASEAEQEPLSNVLFDHHTTLRLGNIGTLRNADCSSVDDFLVRTFISPTVTFFNPAVVADFNASWAMLTVDLGNLDADSDEAVEGPVYLLDFQVRGREVGR